MADFYAPGAIELYFKPRSDTGGDKRYLGTAVEAPEVFSQLITTPFISDITGPAPLQQIFNFEIHQVTATLNRIDYENWQRIKTYFTSVAYRRDLSTNSHITSATVCGQPMLNNTDIELHLVAAKGDTAPKGAMQNRRYYSALLVTYHESTINTRVEEITVVFDCYPYLKIEEYIPAGSQNQPPQAPVTSSVKRRRLNFTLYEENSFN